MRTYRVENPHVRMRRMWRQAHHIVVSAVVPRRFVCESERYVPTLQLILAVKGASEHEERQPVPMVCPLRGGQLNVLAKQPSSPDESCA